MSNHRRICLSVSLAVPVVVAALYFFFRNGTSVPEDCIDAGRTAQIDPDYACCTIPPNIAPLNFVIKEEGTEYRVKVYSTQGEAFVVSSPTAEIVIPMEKWKALLELNRGDDLCFDVYAREARGRWRRFTTITNRIATDDVDSYLAYRRLKPVHTIFTNMGTYQRNVGTYDESPILLSGPDSRRCVNCHTFVNNNPDTMCLHVRSKEDGNAMILARDGIATKINTRTSFNAKPASYISFHPSGRLAAFAAIDVIQFHHSVGNSRDVLDRASDLCLYIVDSNHVTSTPEISDPDRLETFPTWSPDGKYLYFCSAKRLWTEDPGVPMSYRRVRYDLMRIGYDVATGTCGKLETVLSAEDTGLSISEPRVSPDGRFLLFCMSEYGSFAVFHRSSDLYMMDLKDRRYWPLGINSDQSDSWHCWSTNSRWFVFASKRRDGLFGRVYFSYVGPDGNAHKPVLLPQEDPAFYDCCLDNFNAPELITGPVGVGQDELQRAIKSPEQNDATFAGILRVENGEESAPKEPPKAVAINAKEALRYSRLGLAAEKEGRIEKAIRYYRLSVDRLPELHPASVPALNSLAWIYSTDSSERLRNGEEAVLLAERAYRSAKLTAQRGRDKKTRGLAERDLPKLMDTLAAAYAECGRFQHAIQTAMRAETLALQRGQVDLAVRIRRRLELYLVDKPYRNAHPD